MKDSPAKKKSIQRKTWKEKDQYENTSEPAKPKKDSALTNWKHNLNGRNL